MKTWRKKERKEGNYWFWRVKFGWWVNWDTSVSSTRARVYGERWKSDTKRQRERDM